MTKLTRARRNKFLQALKGEPNVARAAAAVGVSRQALYEAESKIDKLEGKDRIEARLRAGIELLLNQIRAAGLSPAWTPPAVKDTGPLGGKV